MTMNFALHATNVRARLDTPLNTGRLGKLIEASLRGTLLNPALTRKDVYHLSQLLTSHPLLRNFSATLIEQEIRKEMDTLTLSLLFAPGRYAVVKMAAEKHNGTTELWLKFGFTSCMQGPGEILPSWLGCRIDGNFDEVLHESGTLMVEFLRSTNSYKDEEILERLGFKEG